MTNMMGCDSTVYLHLTIQNDTHVIDSVVACGPYTWLDSITYFTDTTTPIYNYITSTGCDSTIHLHLTIAETTYGIDSVIACDTFTWINGITYSRSTVVPYCTIVNVKGCDSIVSLHLTIRHKPTDLQLSADRTEIDQGENVILTASGAFRYLWSTGSTENIIEEFPSQTTEYYVIGINADGPNCMDMASVIITVNPAEISEIGVYPNPAKQILTIEGNDLSEASIYNVLGQKALQIPIQSGKNNIQIDELVEGVYTLQVTNSYGKKDVRKFVIRR